MSTRHPLQHDPDQGPSMHPEPNPARRRWLQALSLTPAALAAAGSLAPAPARAATKVKTNAQILILGSGLGGIAVAARLGQLLDGARITIVDRKEEHHYQPGYTLVASGIWPKSKVINRNEEFHPAGVNWVKDMAAQIDPEARTVRTVGGQILRYDYLVVATGTHQDWSLIEGMDVARIGQNGLGSVYPSADAAEATWKAMEAFAQKGGEALMTLSTTPLKCAGAPLKMTFMLRDRLRQAGTLQASKVQFMCGPKVIFGVPTVAEAVLARWQELDIGVTYEHVLKAVDIDARQATFQTPDGGLVKRSYDFLHAVPPMRAPDVVKQSALAWQTGPMAGGGWLEVDKETLQHKRYPNVFGVGDINGTPRGKTAATIKKAAPLVANNLVSVIQGKAPQERFDGYTSCPLITREGSAWLVEFDYEGRLIPTLPVIDPLQDSFLAWMMKVRMLKPAYIGVLKGHV